MSIRLPSHLHCNRHGVFGFRIVIPRDLRIFFTSSEYRVTLKTAEKRQAKLLASGLAHFATVRFERLRTLRGKAHMQSPIDFLKEIDAERERRGLEFLKSESLKAPETPEEVTTLIQHLLDAAPPSSLLRQTLLDLLSLKKQQAAVDERRVQLVQKAVSRLSDNTACEADSVALIAELYAEGAALNKEESDLALQANQFLSAIREIAGAEERTFALEDAQNTFAKEREQIENLAASMVAKVAAKTASEVLATSGDRLSTQQPLIKSELLSTVIAAYCNNQIAEKSWTAKTEHENRAIFALWLRIVGDQPISTYGFEQHRAYKAALMELPPNLNKSPRYRNLTIEQIRALGDTPAAPNTINKNLGRMAALFDWAIKYGYATLNPASGMIIKNPKRANEERQAFTDADLLKLFQTDDFINKKHRNSYMRWTPLIALYSGARLNEIAQLHTADFIEQDGVPVISINDQGGGKRLKTLASQRLIPVHPELVRLGLLQHVERLRKERIPRLFPELKAGRDGYGQTVSKWFARYCDKCGIVEKGKVFHSFRHTVIDQLKQAGTPKEKIAALVGHEDESETFGRYGKDFRPSVMLEVVRSLSNSSTSILMP